MSGNRTIRVVLDPEFGDRLERLAGPVWILESRANTPVARQLWSQPNQGTRFGAGFCKPSFKHQMTKSHNFRNETNPVHPCRHGLLCGLQRPARAEILEAQR